MGSRVNGLLFLEGARRLGLVYGSDFCGDYRGLFRGDWYGSLGGCLVLFLGDEYGSLLGGWYGACLGLLGAYLGLLGAW